MERVTIRPIQQYDNELIAFLIRQILTEFNANKPGTAFFDETLDYLSDVFNPPLSGYWVAEENKTIIGGAGIYPTKGLPDGYCELVKLYLHPNARGKGIGKKLIANCFSMAFMAGYTHVYLETMPQLSNAVSIYEKLGFKWLEHPLGNSGHYNCSIWMVKTL